MDNTSLLQIMQSPNFSMWGGAQQQFDTNTQRGAADLQALLQKTQQEAQAFPVELDQKRSIINNNNAMAAQSQALAKKYEDELGVLKQVPMDKRVSAFVADLTSRVTAADKAELDNSMARAARYASLGLTSGGRFALPLLQQIQSTDPHLAAIAAQPNGAQLLANMVTKYNELGADRQKSDSGHRISAAATTTAAQIGANSREEVARITAEARTLAAQKVAELRRQVVNATDLHASLLLEATKARQSGNEPLAGALLEQAGAIARTAEVRSGAAAKEGAVDKSRLGGGSVPTTPPPLSAPAKPQLAPGWSSGHN